VSGEHRIEPFQPVSCESRHVKTSMLTGAE
jgi:hypothetical protein